MSIFKKLFQSKEKDCCSIKIEEVKEEKNDSTSNNTDNKSECCK
ncbi:MULTISPECIES: hypothetical protein [Bacillus]|nr:MULTISPECIES: hypothetical protein [Bacillus cereus group]ASZ18169.1 hypothetical protein CK938_17005 [Bacillus cereus]MCU5298067.1 hypothetical protein [Bacillus paranthracis]MCU5708658.1 hypothetical protein [Bacillus cereus]MCU5714036.1 hypothetical protein [Bacillus cereus]MDA1609420.1 hypothetical protein [Bacillus cereus group sp. TH208-1LC]